MKTANQLAPATPILSRIDHVMAKHVDTAVNLLFIAGLAAAERYLDDRGVPKRIALRVLTPNKAIRRYACY